MMWTSPRKYLIFDILSRPIQRKVVLLVTLALVGLVGLIAFEFLFRRIDLRSHEELQNQQARRTLNALIITKLGTIENGFHRIAVTSDIRDCGILHQRIMKDLDEIHSILRVFQEGGQVEHVMESNLNTVDYVKETIVFYPDPDQGYVAEVIDLIPRLLSLREITDGFHAKQSERTSSSDLVRRDQLYGEIERLMKHAIATVRRGKEEATKGFNSTLIKARELELENAGFLAKMAVLRWVMITLLVMIELLLSYRTILQIGGIIHMTESLNKDINERKRAEAEALAAEKAIKTIMAKSPFGVVVIGMDRKIRWVNDYVVSIFGEENISTMCGKKCSGYFCPAEENICPIMDLDETIIADEKIFRKENGEEIPILKSVTQIELDDEPVLIETFIDITDRKLAEEQLRAAHAETTQLIRAISAILIVVDEDNCITEWNHVAEQAFELARETVLGRSILECEIAWDRDLVLEWFNNQQQELTSQSRDFRYVAPSGVTRILDLTVSPKQGADGESAGYLVLGNDVTEQRHLEQQLAQAQKLESIGQLAAGIAHEINTPIQYVGDNTRFLDTSFKNMVGILDKGVELLSAYTAGKPIEAQVAEFQERRNAANFEFMVKETPQAIKETLEGIECVAKIVRSMKEFSHPGSEAKEMADINRAIESTITISRNEWKYVADLKTYFDTALPPIPCLIGEFNQVILNLIVNSAHAIADIVGDGVSKGLITISTQHEGDWVEIRVSDTGGGIPDKNLKRIFDPFFTTKEVGKGTGQGLAMAHNVIADKHGGTITVQSEIGQGTVFTLRLPLTDRSLVAEMEAVGTEEPSV